MILTSEVNGVILSQLSVHKGNIVASYTMLMMC